MSIISPEIDLPYDLESSLLGIALTAETARAGANELLALLNPFFDDTPAALAVRDRDGVSLQILAESGAPATWPERLAPRFAAGAEGVDDDAVTWVVPLRATGRIIGAALIGDAGRGAELYRSEAFAAASRTLAQVLHDLVGRMDAEVRRRSAAFHSVDAVAEGMAHQIANSLTGASAMLQLLEHELDDVGQVGAVQRVRSEIGRALVVVEDMHALQRDTGAQDGIIDLGEFVSRIVRFRLYPIREAGITLALDIEPGYMGVRADARGLEHAMVAALRFAQLRSGGSINRSILVRVAARSSIGFEVRITDSGPGDVPDAEPAYFDLPLHPGEFFPRNDRDHPPDLGLVRSILRGCGGYLEMSGSKVEGTTLALVLPRAVPAKPASRDALP